MGLPELCDTVLGSPRAQPGAAFRWREAGGPGLRGIMVLVARDGEHRGLDVRRRLGVDRSPATAVVPDQCVRTIVILVPVPDEPAFGTVQELPEPRLDQDAGVDRRREDKLAFSRLLDDFAHLVLSFSPLFADFTIYLLSRLT